MKHRRGLLVGRGRRTGAHGPVRTGGQARAQEGNIVPLGA